MEKKNQQPNNTNGRKTQRHVGPTCNNRTPVHRQRGKRISCGFPSARFVCLEFSAFLVDFQVFFVVVEIFQTLFCVFLVGPFERCAVYFAQFFIFGFYFSLKFLLQSIGQEGKLQQSNNNKKSLKIFYGIWLSKAKTS